LFLLAAAGCGRAPNVGDSGRRADDRTFYGVTARIQGFDPVKAGDVASSLAISKVYETLLQYAYLERPYAVEPCLAEALPTVSNDGLTYTFRIRRGIRFQDDPCFTATGGRGRELTAHDFIYSILRVADLKNASSGYWAFNDRIAGLDEFRAASAGEAPTDYDRPVAGLRAPDLYTLEIELVRPYPQLLWILTMHYASAVPREAVEFYGREFVNHPVGTGPFILKSWTRNYAMEFVRNPVWAESGRVERYPSAGCPEAAARGLLADAGKPIPFLDRILQFVVDDSTTMWLMFLQGDLETSGISRDNWDAVITAEKAITRSLSDRGIALFTTPVLESFYIGINMDDPLLGRNRKLRQALTCAFNSEAWVRFYNGRITRATGPIPPGVAGYDDKPSPYPFDLDRARTLLAEAGFPDGKDPRTGNRLTLTLDVGSAGDSETRASVDLVRDFYARLGVVLEPVYNNWPTFLGRVDSRQVQLFRLGWVADYPDAENFLQLFYGPNSSPGPNHANYSNPEFDALYEKARVMQDTPERTALYKKMADLVVEDCPWIFTHYPLAYGLTQPWLKNYYPHDFPYGMVKYYRVDSEARREAKRLLRAGRLPAPEVAP
jgi:ABC-type transport system substrate-binding protein